MIADKKRKILADNMCENSLLILCGNPGIVRNGDVYYPFRQSSDMLMLTEVSSPDIVLVGVKDSEIQKHGLLRPSQGREGVLGGGYIYWIIYSDPISDHEKIWGTSRMDYPEIREKSDITDIRSISELKRDLRNLKKTVEKIYALNPKGIEKEKNIDLRTLLKPLRMTKVPEEIEKMREAIRVTRIAHDLVRDSLKPGIYEYEIEAIIAGVYRAHHMTEAYPSIVASGPNACTLHYTRHDRQLESGDLVLVDAGAEYEGYAADVTRVYPVPSLPGKGEARRGFLGFSERQKEVYDSVLAVKEYAESLVKPGVKRLEYEKVVRGRMNAELVKLGLWDSPLRKGMRGDSTPETISRYYYPHSTSHFLGLDVHDTGERDDAFEVGMVITCEPGIYIPEEGIGIRLEDDLIITEDGCENLSRDIAL